MNLLSNTNFSILCLTIQVLPIHLLINHYLLNAFEATFPVVIDVETAGFNAQTDALLEIAATTLSLDESTGTL